LPGARAGTDLGTHAILYLGTHPGTLLGTPGNKAYRPPSNALGNVVPTALVPVFGEPLRVRTKVFGRDEQEHIIALKRDGVSNRDICKELGIGNGFYDTVALIIEADETQIGPI
jgi:hypothetical protein